MPVSEASKSDARIGPVSPKRPRSGGDKRRFDLKSKWRYCRSGRSNIWRISWQTHSNRETMVGRRLVLARAVPTAGDALTAPKSTRTHMRGCGQPWSRASERIRPWLSSEVRSPVGQQPGGSPEGGQVIVGALGEQQYARGFQKGCRHE